MTDWQAAGHKSDATRVLRLYRQSFDNEAKRLARLRSIEALKAAGVTTVIVLWGGGWDADELVAAGFRVIAVDNGSMEVRERGRDITKARKRRALIHAAEAGGYEWRWGDVQKFMHEADGALLDFHGPWSKDKRAAVGAGRDMKAMVVTLVPSHDLSSDALSADERRWAFQGFLRRAWTGRWTVDSRVSKEYVRLLTDYHEDQGRTIFVFVLSRVVIHVRVMKTHVRAKMRRDIGERERKRAIGRYHRLSDEEKQRRYLVGRHWRHVSSGILPVRPCETCGAHQPEILCSTGCGNSVPAARIKRGPRHYCSDPCLKLAKLDHQRAYRLRQRMAAVDAQRPKRGSDLGEIAA